MLGGSATPAGKSKDQGTKTEEVPAVVVFDREGGLTDDDLNAIGKLGAGLNRLGITGATPIVDPFSARARRPLGDVAKLDHGVGPISNDGEAALVVLAINAADHGAIRDGVAEDPRIPRRTRGARACTPTSPARPGSPPTSTRSQAKPARRC